MADSPGLDARIRERLYLYYETGDPDSEQQKATDALRAVLDLCKRLEEDSKGDDVLEQIAWVFALETRREISRGLGLLDD